VCRPKDKGGLGIVNLEIQNDALLLKHLFKIFNHADTPWVHMTWKAYYQNVTPQAAGRVGSFWWRDVCNLMTCFRGITACSPGNGNSVLFWKDKWKESLLAQRFDRLYSFAIDTDVSLRSMLMCETEDQLIAHFAIPLSEQAYHELGIVGQLLTDLRNEETQRSVLDKWSYVFSKGMYSPSAYYRFLFEGLVVPKNFKKLWKSKCLNKQKVFVWLFLVDRLNTRDMVERRHWKLDSGVNCAMCAHSHRETHDHLFFNCDFALKCWRNLRIQWSSAHGPDIMFERAKQSFQGQNFFEIATCALWGIWKQRNRLFFEKKIPSLQAWRAVFKKDMMLISYRVKAKHKDKLTEWIEHF
jgi:hypothetical protein